MLAALVSIYTQRRILHTVAMTGEITLRGLVLPVGGIKEKVLAAKRAGLERVLLPERNQKDVEEIPAETIAGLEVVYVKRMEEVIERVLEKEPTNDVKKLFAPSEEDRRRVGVANGSSTVEAVVA